MKKTFKKFVILFFLLEIILYGAKAQDITTGLVAHYNFENTSGDVIDETGNNNGVNYGATRGVTGKTGNAFNYGGTDDYVYIADSPTLNPTNFTLAYWVKSDGAQSGEYDRLSGFSSYSFDVAVGGSTNSLKIYPGVWYDTGYDLSYNVWTHIAVTYNGTTFRVYANGSEIASYVRSRTLSGNLYFASKYNIGECFDGSIDDARLYSRALSAADVQELYNPGGGSVPTLSLSDGTANENDSEVTFTITLSQAATTPFSFTLSTSDGTAIAGSDYVSISNQYTWPAGTSGGIMFGITPIDDAIAESNETFNVTISNVSNAIIGDGTGVGTIIDNDAVGGLDCSSTVTSYPYAEGFESSPNTWENRTGDDTDWARLSGATGSGSTGPTAAQEGTYYNYIESSSPNYPSKTAILEGPCFDLTGQSVAEFSFYYHMYGAGMGTLNLEASTDGTNWMSLWSLSGNQGDTWTQATVNLGSYLGNTVQLRFYGITGTSYTSDMAVDDLTLTTSSGGGSSFWAQNGTNIYPTNTGNVGIGTTSPDQKLTVKGTIHSEEVIIDLNVPAPDYVFKSDYELLPISQLEEFIKKNSHLPEFLPASEMETAGITLSQVNLGLLKRIEELTLYILEQEKRIQKMEKQHDIEKK